MNDGGYFSEEAATFGDRVAAGRRAMGLSQKDLCNKLGIKLKTLRCWEDDISEPRANKVQMLSGLLGVSLAWLLTGQGEGVSEPSETEPEMIPVDAASATDILRAIRSIRVEYAALGDRLAVLEKQLRRAGAN